MSGLGLKVQVPPSPTKAILPYERVARIASCLPGSAAEQSMRAMIPIVNDCRDYKKVIDSIKNDKYNLLFYEDIKDFKRGSYFLNLAIKSPASFIILSCLINYFLGIAG